MTQVNEPPKTEQVSGDVSAERKALVDAIAKARGHYTPGEMAWAGDGYHDDDRAIADALIAAGWRRGGDAAMTALAREGQHCDEIAAAYRRGQEDMRERAAQEQEDCWKHGVPSVDHSKHIRALPIKGGDDEA